MPTKPEMEGRVPKNIDKVNLNNGTFLFNGNYHNDVVAATAKRLSTDICSRLRVFGDWEKGLDAVLGQWQMDGNQAVILTNYIKHLGSVQAEALTACAELAVSHLVFQKLIEKKYLEAEMEARESVEKFRLRIAVLQSKVSENEARTALTENIKGEAGEMTGVMSAIVWQILRGKDIQKATELINLELLTLQKRKMKAEVTREEMQLEKERQEMKKDNEANPSWKD
jgi:small-conductance mechanosensitive channel